MPIDVDEQDLMDNIKKELKSSSEDYQNDDDSKTAKQLKDAVSWVDKNALKGKVTLEEVYNFLTEFHKQLPDDDKMFLHEPTILELIEDEFKPYVDTEKEYQEIVSSVKQYLSSKQPQQAMNELEKFINQLIKETSLVSEGLLKARDIKSLQQENPEVLDLYQNVLVPLATQTNLKNKIIIQIDPSFDALFIIANGDLDPTEQSWYPTYLDFLEKVQEEAEAIGLDSNIGDPDDEDGIDHMYIALDEPLYENKTTMTNLEKYIKQQIKETNIRSEKKEKLNEIATELIGQYGPEAVNGLYMLAGVLGLPIAALLSTINDGDPLEIKDTLKDLAQSTGSNIKAKAQAIARKLGLNENINTTSELEKYIKQQIKEAKNPLAKKMKEIENQGRIAALETKLAAIAEMIEETEGRLSRIDEDNEFADMMDKNAVKEVRKQLKELEKAKDKLEKERAKMEGKVEKKKEKVVDEKTIDEIGGNIPDIDWEDIDADIENRPDYKEGTITGYSADGREWQAHGSYTEFDGYQVIDDIEEVPGSMNESVLRMQKLAGLITESDIKKKLSLKEESKISNEELLKLLQSNPDKVYLNTGKWPRMNVKNFEISKDKAQVIDFDSRQREFWFFWTGEKYKDAPRNINNGLQLIGGFKLNGTQIWFTVMGGRAEEYLMARLKRPEFTSKPGEIDYLKVAQFGN